ncbi:MAG: aminotransferase class V-fold PLP-dependent enzyme [Nitrospirae bacterium]|nr:MAG: aminotransferase class V-fold PLP-dependent enzyme [Nitrospirota bacterium]
MIYLNYAALCPTRPEAIEAVDAAMQEFNRLLYSPPGLQWYAHTIAASRQAIAHFLRFSEPSGIAFVPNASLAAHLLLSLTAWEPGDVVLSTTHENPSIVRELNAVVRDGVQIVLLDPVSPDDMIEQFDRVLATRPVKAVLLSHVSHVDGRIFPIAEIGAIAAHRQAFLFIDGAQAAGQIPVDLEDQIFDAYFFPGHKWCRGPLGTGALAIHPRMWARHPALLAHVRRTFPAARFEIGTHHIGLIAGLAAACKVSRPHEQDNAESFARRQAIATTLAATPAFQPSSWSGPHVPGIVTCRYQKSADQEPLSRFLYSRQAIVVKEFEEYPLPLCPAIRVSWLPETSPGDCHRLIEGVRDYLAHSPSRGENHEEKR